jgi:hypothetical protein
MEEEEGWLGYILPVHHVPILVSRGTHFG